MVDDKFAEDGIYRQPKVLTDYQYMLGNNIAIPDKENRSCYYAIERDGIVYHVFNAERIVSCLYMICICKLIN